MHINRPRLSPAGPSHAATIAPDRTSTYPASSNLLPLVAASLCFFATATVARAQDTFRPPAPVTYTEKYEVFGGINYSNGQAGQNLPKRYNMAAAKSWRRTG